MSDKSSPTQSPIRVPLPVNGIQANTCHNPLCSHFGVHPRQDVTRGAHGKRDGYRILGSNNDLRSLYCVACGTSTRLKSNLAISEETERLWLPHIPPVGPHCKNKECDNHHRPLSGHPDEYVHFGTNTSGSPRYRCKRCKKTFSYSSRPTLRQRHPEKNNDIFRALINKVPMRRICELMDVGPAVLYQRLGFFEQQCNRFARIMERPLIEGMRFSQLSISIDRQENSLNWGSQLDRRNARLTGIASADNRSGYIFGMHFDHDPSLDIFEVDLHAREIGDLKQREPFRRYARLRLPSEVNESLSNIDLKMLPDLAMPATGARVRRDYTMFGHFQFLKRLLPGADRLLFFLDQEAGIRAACFTAFRQEIIQQKVDAFLVRVHKDMTVDEKRRHLAGREKELAKHRKADPNQSDWNLARNLVKNRYELICVNEKEYSKRWVRHPLPTMSEPVKDVCYITDSGHWSFSEIADMMLWASLHGVDRFFMRIRRRLSLMERPISSPSSLRQWLGTNPYNPEKVTQLIALFRVAHNYILVGEDKKTPAMRLGLASTPFTVSEVLNFDGD